jgi:hypothetical protein
MLDRKPFILTFTLLLAFALANCNSAPRESAKQNTNTNFNSSTPTGEITPPANKSANTNGNMLSAKERDEYLENIARNNRVIKSTPQSNDLMLCAVKVIRFEEDSPIDRLLIEYQNPPSCKTPATYKVYLRNGKVCELPKGKIQNPEEASAEEILEAIADCRQG